MFTLPPLPYRYDALEPTISVRTMRVHHTKHHQAYIDKTNKLAREAGLAGKTMEEIVRASSDGLFNNAAQAWNHAFFWHGMSGHQEKPGESFEPLREDFITQGVEHFGSGWVWMVVAGKGEPKVITTHDGDTAITRKLTPLIVCDLWEHAYYLDYQNDRKAYLEAWFDKVANWRFAENQLKAAKGDGEGFAFPLPEDVSGQRKSA